tara:strand:- start:333 stop:1157 length:825 start_codon:yes stop_codon:yes gene_type:complete
MVQKNILVSILINNYNNQKFIKKCINSCLTQSYKDLEIIIYDDKSNDNSKRIIQKIKNNKIKKIFNSKKKFKSSALNQLEAIQKSFLKSRGEIIFLLDSDDYFLKDKVKIIMNKFKKNKNIGFIQDNPIFFYPNKSLKLKKKTKKKYFTLHTWPYFNPTSTMVFRRSLLSKVLKEISFSKNNLEKMFFDARAFIYIYFFEKNYLNLDKNLTIYTQNDKGDTLSNYNHKNFNWWKRRLEYHKFVKNLFIRKNKFHFKFIDYYLTHLVNIFLKRIN